MFMTLILFMELPPASWGCGTHELKLGHLAHASLREGTVALSLPSCLSLRTPYAEVQQEVDPVDSGLFFPAAPCLLLKARTAEAGP